MIVATAGHIDHGKTRLVRTLTGVDTDRLPEEKARGISIDLGFAHWRAPGGEEIGFVDVPGHERFVRNMLAGVCGIDFALLVVAADDGVMPQTIEHVQILDLLGIRRGLAVITKIDRVGPERVAEVQREVEALLEATTLREAAILPVSTVTGEGVAALREALAQAAAGHAGVAHEGRHFRLAIDRVFTIGGSGTVVTGTVFAGSVATGARLVVSPTGIPVRVRGLRMHGAEVMAAHAGQRCALNLTGAAVDDIARGQWLCDPAVHAPVQRVDAELALLPGTHVALTAATHVHVHAGAGDEIARIAPLAGNAIAPGTRALVQLVFERPVAALAGDRFIVRDSAAQRTLGGGVVLDPFAAAARRRAPERQALLIALAAAGANTAEALAVWLRHAPGGVRLDRFETAYDLRTDAAAALYRDQDLVIIGDAPRIALPRAAHAAFVAAIEARLHAYHEADPAALGMREADLQRAAAPALALPTFHALLQELSHARRVTLGGGVVRLPRHDAADNAADRALWERIYPTLLAAGALAPTVAELAQDTGIDVRTLRDVLFRRRASGAVHRVTDDRFYLRATLASFAATAAAVAAGLPAGSFTAAQYRDAVGTGRTLAIQVLEYLDTLGITVRAGDARRMHHDPVPLLGAAAPFVVAARTAAPRAPQRNAPAAFRSSNRNH